MNPWIQLPQLPRTVACVLLLAWCVVANAQIASDHPGDVGIENDPRVLFTEQFESALPSIIGAYDDVINAAGMSLDVDVPVGSGGQHCIRITNTGGVNNGGHLFKRFTPGWDGTTYIRYYVKYPSTSQGYIHHESVWVGGYNPNIPYPFPRAGDCGLGDARLSIAYEPIADHMNTYMYWGDMRSDPNGDCWGNVMIKGDSVARPVPYDQWLCVELMIKLNDPVTASNGELRIWHNGEEVGYWGPGFPTGHWLWDKFYITPGESPFPGFRWRTDEALNLNYLWIEYYDDTSPPGVSHHILYDHIVVATERIGPLEPSTGVGMEVAPEQFECRISASGQSLSIHIPEGFEKGTIRVFDATGRVVHQQLLSTAWMEVDITKIKAGSYAFEMLGIRGKRHARFVKSW